MQDQNQTQGGWSSGGGGQYTESEIRQAYEKTTSEGGGSGNLPSWNKFQTNLQEVKQSGGSTSGSSGRRPSH